MYLFIINLLRNIIIPNLPNKCSCKALPKGVRSFVRSFVRQTRGLGTCATRSSARELQQQQPKTKKTEEQAHSGSRAGINQHESQYSEREEFTMCRRRLCHAMLWNGLVERFAKLQSYNGGLCIV